MTRSLRSMLEDRRHRRQVYSAPGFWDRKARDYQGSAVSMFVNRNLNRRIERDQFAFFDSALGDVRGQRILDVGCGTGRLSRHLADRGASVSGFDFAAEAVALAESESAGRDIAYRRMSVFELADEGLYDSIAVLGCLTVACRTKEDFAKAIGLLHRALKPGGRLVVVEPFHASFLARVLELSPAEAAAIVAAAGFRIEQRRALLFWPTRLFLSYVEWPAAVTAPVAAIGEGVLRLAGRPASLADYAALSACRTS